MTTLEICRACPAGHYAAGAEDDPAVAGGCGLLLCKGCGDRDVPDRAAWRMVIGGVRPCPIGLHAGAEPVTLRPPAAVTGDWVAERAGMCLACPGELFDFRGAADWHCEAARGAINAKLRDPAAACPRGYWAARSAEAARAAASGGQSGTEIEARSNAG